MTFQGQRSARARKLEALLAAVEDGQSPASLRVRITELSPDRRAVHDRGQPCETWRTGEEILAPFRYGNRSVKAIAEMTLFTPGPQMPPLSG